MVLKRLRKVWGVEKNAKIKLFGHFLGIPGVKKLF
jgi:hypothetical protein